jgi:diguanylate cyclase (GGDEF)-like protein
VRVFARPDDSRVALFQTIMVVGGMGTVVLVMLGHPIGGSGRQRLRLWLDAGTVLTAVAVFLWYYSLGTHLTGGHRSGVVAASATSATLLLVTFGVVKLIMSDDGPFDRRAGVMGSLGVTGTAVGTSAASFFTGGADLRVLFVAQLLPCVLTVISFRYQELTVRRPGPARMTAARRGYSRLPYLAVIAVQVLLVVALPSVTADPRVWGVAAGVVLITALVLGRQLAAFADNQRLQDELRRQATRDGLTGLANRILLEQRVRELAADSSIGVLVIDLDGFKQVNDQYGHQAGDRLLITVAGRLAELLGPGEVAARLGGDEFAVLLPDADAGRLAARAAGLAGRIAAVVAEPIEAGGAWHRVGASVGVGFGRPAEVERALRDADAAMYLDKHARKAAI